MEENEKRGSRDELFSKAVKAGKRTYFFDVKATRNGEKYITITESKRRFSEEQDRFFYEKHKLFLYKEDFEKFLTAISQSMKFVETGEYPEGYFDEERQYDGDDFDDRSFDSWFDNIDEKH